MPRIVDISGPIEDGMWVYGDPYPTPRIEQIPPPDWLEYPVYSQTVTMAVQAGTYLETAAHMDPTALTITAPATSANLGPGFDVLALALDLANEVVIRRRPGQRAGEPGQQLLNVLLVHLCRQSQGRQIRSISATATLVYLGHSRPFQGASARAS